MEIQKQYRPEIEGIRVVAALLVAIYHIWMAQVSGGVDVFFVVSGFLITTSLLSKHARDGYVNFFTFILGLMRRLLPHAFVVLIAVTILSYFILPEVRFFDTMKHILASIFYYENWQLAITGTDYLDQHNPPTPVQHYWAMSIQGQFYIIWFIIIFVSIHIHKLSKISLRTVFLGVLLTLFFTSFAYSIYLTSVNQPWAYFDTRTRVWEFAIGGLLMLFIFKIKLPKFFSFTLGWIGLFALMFTGVLLDVGASFPGYVALIPVMAAVFMLLAGQNPTGFGVEKLLGSKPMVWLGGYSYGIYLWHWPLLIFYYEVFNTQSVSIIHGIIIILISILLSIIVHRLIEMPIASLFKRRNGFISYTPIIVLFVTLLILLGSWSLYERFKSDIGVDVIQDKDYPGAMVSLLTEPLNEDVDVIPSLSQVRHDKPKPSVDGCHIGVGVTEVEVCEYGELDNFKYTVALVGGSKSVHWLGSLESFAHEEQIRILNMTKSGCRFSTSTGVAEDCYEWNENIIDTIEEENPDLVITLADIFMRQENGVPDGYLEQFSRLDERGFTVLALRDTPRFGYSVPECLSESDLSNEECGLSKDKMYPDTPPWDRLEVPPQNVVYRDYTDYFCPDGYCSTIIGNVIVYTDHHHITNTFSTTLGPIIREDVMEILE